MTTAKALGWFALAWFIGSMGYCLMTGQPIGVAAERTFFTVTGAAFFTWQQRAWKK